jgi:hypothetical protein
MAGLWQVYGRFMATLHIRWCLPEPRGVGARGGITGPGHWNGCFSGVEVQLNLLKAEERKSALPFLKKNQKNGCQGSQAWS